MTTFYNEIAGQSPHRLAGLCDAVFAIDMTLLVLDLRVPAAEVIHSEADLWTALVALSPRLVTYLMSFLTLGIFWLGQETSSRLLARTDRGYTWLTILFFMVVSLIPFSTSFLAEFIDYRIALIVYWLNLVLIGVALLGQWLYVRRQGLRNPEVPGHFHIAILRRIFIGQGLYAVGAALCFFNTHWSIGLIMAAQLVLAFAPRPLSRL